MTAAALSPRAVEALLHATANGAGWRRHYVCEPGRDYIDELIAAGMMVDNPNGVIGKEMRCYVATDAGLSVARATYRDRQAAAGLRCYVVTTDIGDGPAQERTVWARKASSAKWDALGEWDGREDLLWRLRCVRVRLAR